MVFHANNRARTWVGLANLATCVHILGPLTHCWQLATTEPQERGGVQASACPSSRYKRWRFACVCTHGARDTSAMMQT
jgi:hypothetical protein